MNDLPKALAYTSLNRPICTLPLRENFEHYRDNGGRCWKNAVPAEHSMYTECDQISCLARSDLQLGLPFEDRYIGPPPRVEKSSITAIRDARAWIVDALDEGMLWCLPGVVSRTVSFDSAVDSRIIDSWKIIKAKRFVPLSVSTVHAAVESIIAKEKDCYENAYVFPRTTTPSSGLYGTDHNNSFIDMSPNEQKREPNAKAREQKPEYTGFLCAAHTSHSYEAGRSRRVAEDVVVRMPGRNQADTLDKFAMSVTDNEGDWRLYIAGVLCFVDEHTIRALCSKHRLISIARDSGVGMYLSVEDKFLCINISPGALVKKCSNGIWADNASYYFSDKTSYTANPILNTSGRDFIRANFSFHYSLTPFIEHNAAVRTTISSAQIPQAVCTPWCPATAKVSPLNVFQPIVTTLRYAKIMEYQKHTVDIASYLPGENVCILYLNHELTHEDSVMVSSKYAELGGFATISTCKYLLPPGDYVPPVGSPLCSKVCLWWKAGCQKNCSHKKVPEDTHANSRTLCTSPIAPTGTVVSRTVTKSGEQSVKVKSFEIFQTGNKVSTGHGQKGVATIVRYEDMPYCVMDNGETIVPDVIMGMASIVSRQTPGQLYETAACLKRLQDPSISHIAATEDTVDVSEEVHVYDPHTGLPYTTLLVDINEDGRESEPYFAPTKATLGFVRMFNQTQMTRERHFTSHRSMKKTTLRTPVKRSKGGALNYGDMEVTATVAAGLSRCTAELRSNGDELIVDWCSSCQRLRLLHTCTSDGPFEHIVIGYDVLVLAVVSKIVYDISLTISVEPGI